MTRRTQELLFAGGVLAVFVVYVLLSLGFGPNARMIPLPMALLGGALTLAQLVRLARREGDARGEPKEEAPALAEPGNRELRALGGIAGFVVMILILGPVAAVFVFTVSYLYLSRHNSAGRSFVIAAMFTTAIFLLFVVGLQLELYHGILQPLVAAMP